MLPTQVLKNEHRVIEQVLNVLEKIAEKAGVENKLDVESAEQAIDFLRNFADKCHHGKEEHQLFPLLENKGFSRETGPTGVMCHEHEEGRGLIRGMAEAVADPGSPDAADRFAGYARAYIRLLRVHIQKEDHCLFSMTDGMLNSQEQDYLLEQFERVEAEDMGTGAHERYLDVANALADKYGVEKVEQALAGRQAAFARSHVHQHA
jgi:hemerythrin-like domain-containing protein